MITTVAGNQNSVMGWVESRIGFHSFSVSLNPIVGSKLGTIEIRSLVVDEELAEILQPLSGEKWFIEKLEKFKTAKALAIGIQNIVDEIVDQDKQSRTWDESALPQLLMRELDDVGWDRILKVNEDLTLIQMRSIDGTGREHLFDVLIRPGYPVVKPEVRAILPFQIQLPWTPNLNLRFLVSAVDKEIKKCEKLITELSEIDTKTWVLEPAQPNFAVTSRRLAIERSCSIVLDLNIDNPRDVCTMNFFGPPNRVNHFRSSLSRNLHLWSTERSVRENIGLMLDISLPNKNIDSAINQNLCEECGICYTYSISTGAETSSSESSNFSSFLSTAKNSRNDNRNKSLPISTVSAVAVPDQACSNSKCCKIYHFTCLVDWLQSLPNSMTSFGTLFGSCPYCQEAISIRIQR